MKERKEGREGRKRGRNEIWNERGRRRKKKWIGRKRREEGKRKRNMYRKNENKRIV